MTKTRPRQADLPKGSGAHNRDAHAFPQHAEGAAAAAPTAMGLKRLVRLLAHAAAEEAAQQTDQPNSKKGENDK
jgi:hypothetical protein